VTVGRKTLTESKYGLKPVAIYVMHGNGKVDKILTKGYANCNGTYPYCAGHNLDKEELAEEKLVCLRILNDEFHVFQYLACSKKIVWLKNGYNTHFFVLPPSKMDEFNKPFFFIFNLSVGEER